MKNTFHKFRFEKKSKAFSCCVYSYSVRIMLLYVFLLAAFKVLVDTTPKLALVIFRKCLQLLCVHLCTDL